MKIKNWLAVGAVSLMYTGAVWAAPSITWGSHYALTTFGAPPNVVYVQGGVTSAIPQATTTWDAQVIRTNDMAVLWSASVSFWQTGFDGVCADAVAGDDLWNGAVVFTRIFNPTMPGYTVDLPNTTLSWGSPAPAELQYDINPNGQTIVIIPEPGAMMFLLIGAATLVYRRMRQRN